MAHLPTVKSMILCEDVLPGPRGTGNAHLMNVFSAIRPRSGYPYRFPKMCVFVQLTDAEGEMSGRVVGKKADADEVIFVTSDTAIHLEDRLQLKWVVFRISD